MENNESFLLKSGTRLSSPGQTYIIERALGHGGFGVTYLAHHEDNPSVRVAIKEHFVKTMCSRDDSSSHVIFFDHLTDRYKTSMRDFISEARRLQKESIAHPNIVAVGEVFELNNTAYYSMEFLNGQSLGSYVEKKGPLSEQETIDIMWPVIDAVGLLHRNRLTHLDIKPDNIMMTTDALGRCRPVLIDFGLAKHYDEGGHATSTINTLGVSDGFAPFEQYAGITTFSPTADIYSLGATMLYCLTGQNPPKAAVGINDTIASLIPSDISEPTYNAICYAMDWDKDSRTASIEQLQDDLSGELDAPYGYEMDEVQVDESRNNYWLIICVIAAALVVVLLLLLILKG